MKKPVGPWLLTLVLSLLFSSAVFAQNTVGEISGYVRDPSGGVLPGASVTVIFSELAISRTVATNDQGFYLIANLPTDGLT